MARSKSPSSQRSRKARVRLRSMATSERAQAVNKGLQDADKGDAWLYTVNPADAGDAWQKLYGKFPVIANNQTGTLAKDSKGGRSKRSSKNNPRR